MKKIFYLLCIVMLFFAFDVDAKSKKQINIYLFHGDGCPHCTHAKEFLEPYVKKNSNIKLYQYETWYNADNKAKMKESASILNTSTGGVPFIIIGEKFHTGFAAGTDKVLIEYIDYYLNNDYYDPVGEYLGVKSPSAKSGTSFDSPSNLEDDENNNGEETDHGYIPSDSEERTLEYTNDELEVKYVILFLLIGTVISAGLFYLINKKVNI